MFKSLLIVSLMMVSVNAVAATEDVATSGETRAQVRERSSEHYRMNKDFELTFSPVSFGGFALTNQGLTAGLFLNRNSQVTASYSWNSADRTCFNGPSNCNIDDKFFSLSYKRFMTNTLYMQGGATQHNITYTASNSSDDVMFGYDANITTADFTFGNQWNFNGFTIGCDWVSVSLPIAASYSNLTYRDPSHEADATDLQDKWKKTGKIFFSKLYLGATF